MTPEGKIKELTKRLLKRHAVYWHMPIQNGMGAPSLDFICCCEGLYFAVETKAPGKKPTVRQLKTISDIELAKGKTFVVDGEESLAKLDVWLQEIQGNASLP